MVAMPIIPKPATILVSKQRAKPWQTSAINKYKDNTVILGIIS
jgi:hypothetical protein